VLWDVIDEHLAESEFLFEQVQRSWESLSLTPDRLEKGLEARLGAHVDGIVVGGRPVRELRLVPAIADAAANPEALPPAALALATAAEFDALGPAFALDDADARATAVRACVWAADERAGAWVASRFASRPNAPEQGSLLDLAAGLRVRLTPIVEWLQNDDAALAAAAARASVHSDPAVHRHVVDDLLEDERAPVRDAALVAALAWGTPRARSTLARLALDPKHPSGFFMALYAALGGPADHERLTDLLAQPACARHALLALGFSGNVRALGPLQRAVEGPDEGRRKLAAHAISMITGGAPAPAKAPAAPPPPAALPAAEDDPEARASLPPLEDDALDADLAANAGESLPEPDVAKTREHCAEILRTRPADRRWLGGEPFTLDALVRRLAVAPLGHREVHAAALFVRSRGTAWVHTRRPVAVQRVQMAGAADAVRRWASATGGW
jgi:uncharacterized protein (TIGR02270 family)